MVCSVCHNSVGYYQVSVTTIQIAHHTVGGRLCSGSGKTRQTR